MQSIQIEFNIFRGLKGWSSRNSAILKLQIARNFRKSRKLQKLCYLTGVPEATIHTVTNIKYNVIKNATI